MGVQNLVWGSDFPHQESEYPNSLSVIEQNFRGVDEDDRHAMVCGNIASFLNL
jgi:predicted TIM-barrel fold metal-dependent hydrolase